MPWTLIIIATIVLVAILLTYVIYRKIAGVANALNPFNKSMPRGVGTAPLLKACPAGQRDDGTSCWLDSVGRGAGRSADIAPCPAGMSDDGLSCWKNSYGRGAGYAIWDYNKCVAENGKCELYGAMYYPVCKDGYKPFGCCICEPIDGAGIKLTVFDRYRCKDGEDLYAGRCYPKCGVGYHSVGCCICEPDGGPSIKADLFSRQYCPPGKEMDAGLCYDKCNSDEHGVGPVCWKN